MERLKTMVKAFSYHCGYYHLTDRLRRIRDRQGRLLVLTYHDLSDDPKPGTPEEELFKLRPSVTKRQFESHLQVLKKGFKTASLPDVVKEMKDRGRLENDSVAITFDDGCESFYRLAFPLLKKYDLPATLFLPTDFIGTGRAFWWDELLQIVFRAAPQRKSASLLMPVIGEKLAQRFCSVGNDLRRKRLFLESLELYLRNIEEEEREAKIKDLKRILLPDQELKPASSKTLGWDQIAEMVRGGIDIGSHTCSHLNLRFASSEKAEEELAKSKEIIERRIKARVVCFAYPYDADFETGLRVRPVLAGLKYECACTSSAGVNLSGFDPFFLQRVTLPMTAFRPVIVRELLLNYSGKFKGEAPYA
jgi:peptidoglycan/xylan/chitin deacetylase (PgdA/CDA1 family)